MAYVVDSLRVMFTTLRTAFRPPTTVEFPAVKRPRPERTRLSFALVHDENGEEACVGCLQCERICPSEIITITADKRVSEVTGKKRGYATDFTLDLNACIYCELCVQVCPTDAILMTKTHHEPSYSREDLVLTMDKLYANEEAHTVTWASASVLQAMQDPKRGEADAKPAKKPAAKKTGGRRSRRRRSRLPR